MKTFTFKQFKKKAPPLPESMWRNPLHFIAFGFGAGSLPAPGTFGTLMALPFYLLLRPLPLIVYLSLVCLITVGAIWLCHRVEKELAVHDHPGMCIDEIVGYLITMIHAPPGWLWILLGFLLFRIFDIWKPWPLRQIDSGMGGGLGVILDDVLAGVYSFIGIQVLAFLLAS
ncbi:MAG TPA: phosphatidylglycerophosphatase A [Gammaproteobacteria bacterium]|nr:phosphatidylglycerophosphatase A [Gammaproteobacteria bacterium]